MSTLKELHDNTAKLIVAMECYLNKYKTVGDPKRNNFKMYIAIKKHQCIKLEKLCPPALKQSSSLLNKFKALKTKAKENIHLRLIIQFKIKLHKIKEQTQKINRHNSHGLPKRKFISRGKPIDQWDRHSRFLDTLMKKINSLVTEIQTIESEVAAKYNEDNDNCRYPSSEQSSGRANKATPLPSRHASLFKQSSQLPNSRGTQSKTNSSPSTPLLSTERSQANIEQNCFKTCLPCFFSQKRTATELNNPVREYNTATRVTSLS